MDWNKTPVLDSIQLPGSDTKYWMKDTEAREKIEALVSVTHFLGITTTELTDGAATNPITINNEQVTAVSGDIAIYKKNIGLQEPLSLEFIFDGTYWQLLGGQSIEGAGDLAYKDSASGSYTPGGSVTLSTSPYYGDIKVLNYVYNGSLNVDFGATDNEEEGRVQVLTGIGASFTDNFYNYISTSIITAGSKTDAGSLPTLSGITVNGLTASINNTTLVLGTSEVNVSYSFNSGSFPTYSFASIKNITETGTASALTGFEGTKTYLYATMVGELDLGYSWVTGTFTGSPATITVS